MLRVGLTGELGSGKSTVARLLAAHGAIVLSSDEMARAMMEPGKSLYRAVVDHFGRSVLLANGQLDRSELARLAFHPDHLRVEELNAIIHPAVLAEQETRLTALARNQPGAIAVVESALIFTTKHAGGESWRERFDRVVLVTAPDETKLERFVQRAAGNGDLTDEERRALRMDAHRRLSVQRIAPHRDANCLLINNAGCLDALTRSTEEVWRTLTQLEKACAE